MHYDTKDANLIDGLIKLRIKDLRDSQQLTSDRQQERVKQNIEELQELQYKTRLMKQMGRFN